jgi:hypothetical protein
MGIMRIAIWHCFVPNRLVSGKVGKSMLRANVNAPQRSSFATFEPKNPMPTVLDSLREHLLGDELADRLEQWLTTAKASPEARAATAARAELTIAPPNAVECNCSQTDSNPILQALRTPSPGYEPLLLEGGWNQFAARAMAKLAVRHGKRVAAERPYERGVAQAIRFLAKGPRQHRAIVKRAKVLVQACVETSLVDTLFDKAKLDETEFINLLRRALDGHRVDRHRLTDIAAAVAPHISIKRGAKITAWSAAHEFLFRQELELSIKRRPYLGRGRKGAYCDPRTEATRLEFNKPTFD